MARFARVVDVPWHRVSERRAEVARFGLSPRPADRVTTEQIITELYQRIGRRAPGFAWFDGPISCLLAGNALRKLGFRRRLGKELQQELRALWSELVHDLMKQVETEFGDDVEIWSLLEGAAWNEECWLATPEIIRESIFAHREVNGQLAGRVAHALDRRIADLNESGRWQECSMDWERFVTQFREQTGLDFANPLDKRWVGPIPSFWSGVGQAWLAHYLGYECVGVTFDASTRDRIMLWEMLHRASGWWFPFEQLVLCSERLVLHVDSQGRLHNARGPVVECRDGHALALHAWHGTDVPGPWIEQREQLHPATALTWPIAAQRRAAAEILGWAKVLKQLAARAIDVDPDPQIGALLECNLPAGGVARLLRVQCATGREFVLRVPREMTTARQANAWTYGVESEQLQLQART